MMGKGTFVFAALCEIVVGRQAVTSNSRNEQIFSDGHLYFTHTVLRGQPVLQQLWRRAKIFPGPA